MHNNILIVVFSIVFGVRLSGGTLIANQKHLCLKTETYRKVIFVDKISPVLTVETSWCWDWSKGFRCRSPKSIYKHEKVPQTINRTRSVLACCTGFMEIESKCVPRCPGGCVNGRCTESNTCDCYSGFHGPICDKICPPNRWGRRCLEECDCLNEAECDRINGRCICVPGWQGPRCESACLEGYYGPNCQEKCDCYNDACNHVTGTCQNAATENTFSNVKVVHSLMQPDTVINSSDAVSIISDSVPLMRSNAPTRGAPSASSSPVNVSSTTIKYSKSPIGGEGSEEMATTTSSTTSTLETAFSSTSDDPSGTTVSFTEFAHTMSTVETNSRSFEKLTETPTEATSSIQETFTEDNERVANVFGPKTKETKVSKNESSRAINLSTSMTTTQNGISTRELASETNDSTRMPGHSSQGVTANKHDDNVSSVIHFGRNKTGSSENVETILKAFDAPPFVPSLSVLTAVSILIMIIGAWWIALQNKRKNKKILAKRQEEIFKSKEKYRFQDGLLTGFLENSVNLCEINAIKERPVLQTFKPYPNM